MFEQTDSRCRKVILVSFMVSTRFWLECFILWNLSIRATPFEELLWPILRGGHSGGVLFSLKHQACIVVTWPLFRGWLLLGGGGGELLRGFTEMNIQSIMNTICHLYSCWADTKLFYVNSRTCPFIWKLGAPPVRRTCPSKSGMDCIINIQNMGIRCSTESNSLFIVEPTWAQHHLRNLRGHVYSAWNLFVFPVHWNPKSKHPLSNKKWTIDLMIWILRYTY